MAKTLLCRFFRWRTSSRPKPRLPPMTKHDPGSGGKGVSSAEEDAIVLVEERAEDLSKRWHTVLALLQCNTESTAIWSRLPVVYNQY